MKKIYNIVIISLCSLIFTPSYAADSIFIGQIITANPQQPTANAVAVQDGKIIAVGDKAQVLKSQRSDTRIIELGSHVLMPGLIDAHTHPITSAVLGAMVDVSGFNNPSVDAVYESLREGIRQTAKDDWVVAVGWDPALLTDLAAPTLAQLDQLAPDNPLLIITQTLHTAFVNSLAFARAGVDKHTPDPAGGYFERDKNGELTGTVIEVNAIGHFLSAFPTQSPAAYQYILDQQLSEYAKAGYTTIVAPGLQPLIPNHIQVLQEAVSRDHAPVRARTYPVFSDLNKASSTSPHYSLQNGDHRFKVMGIKLWVDGSPYAGGMATNEPYINSEFTRTRLGIPAGSRGHLNFTNQQLHDIVAKHHRQGWQIAAHVQGERAIDQYLNVMESVLQAYPRNDHRHRLEHNALITPSQLARAQRLGVTVSFYIEHVAYYGDTLREQIVGEARAQRFMPMQSALDVGHRVSLHTDTPSSPLGVVHAMQTAVLRQTASGETLGEQQRISVNNAINAVTIDAAWQIFEEHQRGSIEVGKVADFTVLSANLLTTPPAQWHEVQVVNTYLAGEQVTHPRFTFRAAKQIVSILWNRWLAWF